MTTNDNNPVPSDASQPLAGPATAALRFEKRIDKSFWTQGMTLSLEATDWLRP